MPRRAQLLLSIAEAYRNAGLADRAAQYAEASTIAALEWKQENWQTILQRTLQTIKPGTPPQTTPSCDANPFWARTSGEPAEFSLVNHLLSIAQFYATIGRLEEGRWVLSHAAELVFLWQGQSFGAQWLCRLYTMSVRLGDEGLSTQILERAPSFAFSEWTNFDCENSNSAMWMIRALAERGDFERAHKLTQRLAQTSMRIAALIALAEGYRATGQLRTMRSVIAQAIDEAQQSTRMYSLTIWQDIGLQLTRLDRVTLRQQRRTVRHPQIRLGIDALLADTPRQRYAFLHQARMLESLLRRAWLLCLVGVGAIRRNDATLAEQAFKEAAAALEKIIYHDTRAMLQAFLEKMQTLCDHRQETTPPSQESLSSDDPPNVPFHVSLKQRLEARDYLTALYATPHARWGEEFSYSMTEFVAAQLAKDPRCLFLLPVLMERLSNEQLFTVAYAFIKAGDYCTALRLVLYMRSTGFRAKVVLEVALAHARRGQKEMAFATIDLMEPLLIDRKTVEDEINYYLYQIYAALNDAEQAAKYAERVRQSAEQKLTDEEKWYRVFRILAREGRHEEISRLLIAYPFRDNDFVLNIAAMQMQEGAIREGLETLARTLVSSPPLSEPSSQFVQKLSELLLRDCLRIPLCQASHQPPHTR